MRFDFDGKDATTLISFRDLPVRTALRARNLLCAIAQSLRRGTHALLSLIALLSVMVISGGVVRADVELPVASPEAPLIISAQRASHWEEGQYQVWLLGGGCRIQQDQVVARSRDAVLWIDRAELMSGAPSKIIAYLETDVSLDFGSQGAVLEDRFWLGRFHTSSTIDMRVPPTLPAPSTQPPVVERGREARHADWERTAVRQAQFSGAAPQLAPTPTAVSPSPSVSITPRSSARFQAESFPSPDPNETIVAISTGVRIVISDIASVQGVPVETVIIEADRIVFWTNALAGLSMSDQAIDQPSAQGQWEFYLEGNIVFREGERVIEADRMYYHVNENRGLILNAEALTPVEDFEGLVRLKADVLQQLNRQSFQAFGAALTSSRMGVPRYWVQAENISVVDQQQLETDPTTGSPVISPETGEPEIEHQLLATSQNNFLYVGGFPVFFWPVLATDSTKPTYYVDNAKLKNDSVFGTQALIDWDLYQLLGIQNRPHESDWTLSTNYLSQRGFGLGTNFSYEGDELFQVPGQHRGFLDAWGIKDNGLDNLGADRRALLPEQDFRGRILGRHRQQLPIGYQLSAELGLISDRNFLEQYYEQEWDEFKDQTTGFELKRYAGNQSWSITGDVRLNDFFTETEWLPRADHFLLGQSLLGDYLTWHAHSHVGYARLEVAEPPSPINPGEVARFSLLPWEVDREGIHTATRHELDLPLDLGPVKVVPYVLGEAAHIGESVPGPELTRTYGQTGVRASLPMWSLDPEVRDLLFNLNGLAHKVEFDAEFLWAEADEELERFPLYEPLDDNATEAFRRRLAARAGGMVPRRFDERFFALRSGMQSSVTAPSTAIADDLSLLKLGVRQRWQTKRGLPGQERIIDWIVLDVQGTLFPDPDRDNFGQEFGLLDYDFRWHVGDRFTLLSEGFADFFGDGLRTFTLGGVLTRPERGEVYLGFRSIEGPITSNILNTSVSFRMSEKWIVSGGASVDLGPTGNIGQSLALTRIGESALLQVGFNVDESRDNVGVTLAIEPRFLATGGLGEVGGARIPPAGVRGLE